MSAPQPIWLFDLDDTLHDATRHIFPLINQAMREYIARQLGVDEARAGEIRQHYWQRYGATLLGLMRHHGTDPHDFLQETHRFSDLPSLVRYERNLRASLHHLPGRKLIFSNAPRHYAQAILAITGIARLFDALYSVEDLRFRAKPMLHGFRTLLHAERIDPRHCIMVEDNLGNLKPAKRLGMRTVWVGGGLRTSPWADIKVASVTELPRRIGELLRAGERPQQLINLP
jgi:putative hydrolase of the HAD superfamily